MPTAKNKPSTIKEFINNIKNNDKESLDNAYNKMFPEFKNTTVLLAVKVAALAVNV